MNVAEITTELIRLSRLLDTCNQELVTRSREWALAERDYRKQRVVAFHVLRGEKMTADERGASADASTADARYARDLAESLKQAALEHERSVRAQLSAVQSIGSALKSEMALSGRDGP